MSGIKPTFIEESSMIPGYYEAPDPYAEAPLCPVNLLELSRYARKKGKKLAELTKNEILLFANGTAKTEQDATILRKYAGV